MPTLSAAALARFEEELRKDPASQVFAPLADAYLSEGRFREAERVAGDGVRRNPKFAGGWVMWGKVQRELKKTDVALEAFQRAIQLAPENLLALQLMGETLLELKRPKEALKAFKRVLFLNPLAEKAKRIVEKLESLTADEFDEEVFAMAKLTSLETNTVAAKASARTEQKPADVSKALTRMLSLIDAFIVRNDISRAQSLLDETRAEFGEHHEIAQRALLLQRRRSSHLAVSENEAEPLAPLSSREEAIRLKKISNLKALLRAIDTIKDTPLTT